MARARSGNRPARRRSPRLFVGYGGTGNFTAQNGGQVEAVDTYVGHLAGSNGTATVTGAGSTWTGCGNIYVGNSGTGTFNVLAGGAASSALDTVPRLQHRFDRHD